MQKIFDNLYIGSLSDYHSLPSSDWAFVHATQTVHYQILGWDSIFKRPNKNHPNYIKWQKDNRFSLNWLNGQPHLYELSGPETFIEVLDFIDNWINKRPVLLHCIYGQSRSPTLGLLYLAKRAKIITNDSFTAAKEEFTKIYSIYSPGDITDYVDKHWEEIK